MIDFVVRSRQVHGNRYDYSKSIYTARKRKLVIICEWHGEFQQSPADHWRGKGCQQCGLIRVAEKSRQKSIKASKLFIYRASQIHKHKYDYSLVNYCGNKNSVTIVCPEHGKFTQSPTSHLHGRGCPSCGQMRSRISNLLNSVDFLTKCFQVHGGYYDYSKTSYVNSHGLIAVICPTHGEFKQLAYVHMRGGGCKKCAVDAARMSKDCFVAKANVAHDHKYGYDQAEYINTTTAVFIKCPFHGMFEQAPNSHLRGHGCRKCNLLITANQIEIANFIKQFYDCTINDRSVIAPYEIDVYVPNIKFGVEYHGAWWHSHNQIDESKKYRHKLKADMAIANRIKLFQIYDFEWQKKRHVVESMIMNACGRSTPLDARKLREHLVSPQTADDFINDTHLYGARSAGINLVLVDDGGVKICMTFCKHSKYGWEIVRLASARGYYIRGGASRLFSMFVALYDPMAVIAYADRRFSNGNVYKELGFEHVGVTRPNYRYVRGGLVFSRQTFQKSKLNSKLEHFNPDLSESANMYAHGYKRLWDAGHNKLIWTK